MNNSEQETQDQRTNPSMEDSTAMTIEFLRARLLSERSVSKSARQRADELARRVAELEEQLKMVCLQRKKAEKATADVLAILENNGISDISEAFDSSSDEEIPCESKVVNSSNREEKNLVIPKLRRNDWEELSGSDIDFSPVHQRGLSWKGSKENSHSSGKYKDNYMRRRSSFGSVGSSPKHRAGKSCRQIRRRDSKSVVEELKTDPIKVDSQENGAATSVEVSLNNSDARPEILKEGSEAQHEKLLPEVSHSGCLENEKAVTIGDVNFIEHEEEKTMEQALEHQAQLIGKYEEMEKAQREWEERFRENNSSSPDSYDPGNQSDVTEEREEIKAQVEYPSATINTVQETKSEDVCFSNKVPNTQSNGLLPPSNGDLQCLGDQKFSCTPASKSLAQDVAFPMATRKQIQESLKNDHYPPSHSSHHHTNPHPHVSSGNHPAMVVSSDTGSGFATGKVSGSQNELYALVPHEKPNGFNEVLEALRQAKLSLQHGASRVPLRESKSVEKAIEPSVPAMKVWDSVDIPVGWAGLFRLPTDYAVEESSTNFLASSSGSKLGNYYPKTGLGVTGGDGILTNSYMDDRSAASAGHFLTAGDKFVPRPSMDRRSNYSTDDRLFTSQYSDILSKIPTHKPSFDGNLDAGIPSSRQYAYTTISSPPDLMPRIHTDDRFSTFPSRSVGMPPPNLDAGLTFSSPYSYPAFSSHLEPMPRVPTGEGFPTLRPSRSVGMPTADHSSFYGDHTRTNMYR